MIRKIKVLRCENKADVCTKLCNTCDNPIIIFGKGQTFVTKDCINNIPYYYLPSLILNESKIDTQLKQFNPDNFVNIELFGAESFKNIIPCSYKQIYLNEKYITHIFYDISDIELEILLKEFANYEVEICK